MLNLFKPVSYQKGAALAVASTAGWKIISFVNSILIALYFGAKSGTDLYFYLIMLIGFGVTFLQKLNTTVLVPEAMFLARSDESASRRFLNFFLLVYAAVCVLVCLAGFTLAVPTLSGLSRFTPQLLQNNSVLLGGAFCLFASNLLVSYLTSVAEMHKFFGTVLLTPLNALLPLLSLLLFGHSAGIVSMVYGFLAANLIQILVFLVLLKLKLNWDFTPSFIPLHKRTQKNMLAGQTLEIVGILNSLLPVYLISGLGAGLISVLNYAKQIADAPVEIIVNRVSNVSKIQLTEDASGRHFNTLNRHFLNTSHFLLFLLVPVSVFVSFYAYDVIALFFMRGRFTSAAAQAAADFLRPLIFMIVILVPVLMQSNVISATRKVKESFGYLLLSNLFFTVLAFGGISLWGAFSYPYLLLASNLVGFWVNYFLFKKHFPFIKYAHQFLDFGRLLSINIIALFFSALAHQFLGTGSHLLNLLFGGVVYITVLILAAWKSGDLRRFLEHDNVAGLAKKLF